MRQTGDVQLIAARNSQPEMFLKNKFKCWESEVIPSESQASFCSSSGLQLGPIQTQTMKKLSVF